MLPKTKEERHQWHLVLPLALKVHVSEWGSMGGWFQGLVWTPLRRTTQNFVLFFPLGGLLVECWCF